ncbi:hypothetical protein ABZ063_43190, partial [Streptomyces sp. NPDC006333]
VSKVPARSSPPGARPPLQSVARATPPTFVAATPLSFVTATPPSFPEPPSDMDRRMPAAAGDESQRASGGGTGEERGRQTQEERDERKRGEEGEDGEEEEEGQAA